MSTNDPAIAERARRLRTHGLVDRNTAPEFGIVSRMDIIQAEILRWRLKHTLVPAYERRRRNVELYRKLLDQAVTVPSAATQAISDACREAAVVVSIGAPGRFTGAGAPRRPRASVDVVEAGAVLIDCEGVATALDEFGGAQIMVEGDASAQALRVGFSVDDLCSHGATSLGGQDFNSIAHLECVVKRG